MNEAIKAFKYTVGFFILLSLLSLGWNLYEKKKAEAYCQELKGIQVKLEKSQISSSTLKVEKALHNCY
ncbi:hypothetical protein BV372_07130 [Nostoc sp. T09]|uniref:hypothetical protein n=1 Tax=Nostoc sp. T09 TaxID=1932621 RepID=UPI000A3B487B|nr:hypothetical protein [Nostoc sp. T09]OUL36532.1 hypothetical protein BV372_07130 [Nostoc sp. T09]